MKRYYKGLIFVIFAVFLLLFSTVGFIWESIDVGEFVVFAFVTSVMIPFCLVIILSLIFGKYVTIDEKGVKFYFVRIKLREYDWINMKEIKLYGYYVYFSLIELKGKPKEWDKKKYIYLLNTERLWRAIKKYAPEHLLITE